MSYVGNKPAQTTIPVDDSVTTAMLKDDAVTSAKIDDGTIATADIADDAVTVDKVANAINTSIAANTAKVTNATHTGDVTGATALTIAADAVDIAMLSATGTADATTFLRGDNAWAEAGGGKCLQIQTANISGTNGTSTATTFTDTTVTVAITPTAATSKILVWASFGFYVVASSRGQLSFRIFENSTSTSIVEFNDRYFSTATTSQPQNSISGKFDCVDTSALSFRVQAKIGSGSGVSYYYPLGYGTQTMTIIAMEIGA